MRFFSGSHQSNLKWYQIKSIFLLVIGIVLGSGIREMNSFLPHYKSANNLIQNHNNSPASLAVHNLAISNEFFHQFRDFIVQSQSNPGHSASSFLDKESIQNPSLFWPFNINAKSFSDAKSSVSIVGKSLNVELAPRSHENVLASKHIHNNS